MSKISIKHAVKKYGNNTVIPDLNALIKDGELFTLLGPSGCGKTTLLRMIAGFNSIEGGDICFNDTRINDMDPSKRNIGMVFQNYAIFPNMTVRDNVAFGLKNRKMDKDKIKEQTDKYLNLMQIMQYAERMPNQLSGGQQQRVALARALVIMPDVLLMDEPLSNLDAKLRLEMRSVIRHTQKDVGITTVYVTHDQEEVFSSGYRVELDCLKQAEDQEVLCSIRPEEFVISPEGSEGIRGVVKEYTYLGLNTHYFVETEDHMTVEIVEESSIEDELKPNQKVLLQVKKHKINLFNKEGSVNLVRSEAYEG